MYYKEKQTKKSLQKYVEPSTLYMRRAWLGPLDVITAPDIHWISKFTNIKTFQFYLYIFCFFLGLCVIIIPLCCTDHLPGECTVLYEYTRTAELGITRQLHGATILFWFKAKLIFPVTLPLIMVSILIWTTKGELVFYFRVSLKP